MVQSNSSTPVLASAAKSQASIQVKTNSKRGGTMRTIVVAEFITLDGVIQAPGGAEEDTEGGFRYGGWTWPYWHDDIGAHFFEAMSRRDALLGGRKTWQIHGGALGPMPGRDRFGDVIDRIPKYVVSTPLPTAAAWRNARLARDQHVRP